LTALNQPYYAALTVFTALVLSLPAWSGVARGESLVTGISDDTIAIESNFVGAELILFGTIERDANTVARRHGYDIAVVVTGPAHDIVVRKKERFAGIWINRRSRSYTQVPSFVAVLSNRPLGEITTPATLSQFQLGLENIELHQFSASRGDKTNPPEPFDRALLRLMSTQELYLEEPDGVEFLSDSLFNARIRVPAYVPVGRFAAEVFLFGDGALLQRQKIKLKVHKSGFEQMAFTLATQQSLLYGLLAVAMAIFAGWLASVIFRKD